MLGYIILGIIILAVGLVLFSPGLKGWRTQIFNSAVAVIGVALPILREWVDFLQVLDWRTYIMANDKRNLAVVGVVAGLALVGIYLRYITTGPVGTKE